MVAPVLVLLAPGPQGEGHWADAKVKLQQRCWGYLLETALTLMPGLYAGATLATPA